MGSERHDEDSHKGPWHPPKLTLVGRLEGTLDGRPWSLEAEKGDLALTVAGLASLLSVRRLLRQRHRVLSPLISSLDARAHIKCGRWPSVSLSTRSPLFSLLVAGSLSRGQTP